MGELDCRSMIIESTSQGVILEIIFRSDYTWDHGRSMRQYIKEKASTTRTAGIVINLLDYHYEWGNDIAGLFEATFDRRFKPIKVRPVGILARGKTHESLYQLCKEFHILDGLNIKFFSTLGSAVSHIKKQIEKDNETK